VVLLVRFEYRRQRRKMDLKKAVIAFLPDLIFIETT